jgi:hypothetical protein
MAFLTQSKAKLCKILIITLVFEKNANFFRRKWAKIAENCDMYHNIDPWLNSGVLVPLHSGIVSLLVQARLQSVQVG